MEKGNYKAEMLNKRLNARFKGMEEIYAYYDANLVRIVVFGKTRLAGWRKFYYPLAISAYELLRMATNDLVKLKCEHIELEYEENKAFVKSRKDTNLFYAEMWAKHYA